MSQHDIRLISSIVRTRDINLPLKFGITRSYFSSPEYGDAFRFIVDHYGTYDEVPSVVRLKQEFPALRVEKVSDSLDVVIDSFIEDYRYRRLFLLTEDLVSMFDKRATSLEIHARIAKELTSLDATNSAGTIVNLADNPDRRYDEYLQRANSTTGLLGVATGFPTIDETTLGLQEGQLVTIIAQPKTGKSQLAMRIAANVQGQGYVPLFQTFEMSVAEMEKRYDSMVFGLSHKRLLNGDLVSNEEKKYKTGLSSITNDFHLSDSSVGMTVSALGAQAMSANPDVLFVDGVYLMIDEVTGERGTPQALTNITRNLKRLAQRLDIPVVITTQVLTWKVRKNRIDPNAIGYSSSFYQDSDVILALESVENVEDARLLRVVASRNSGLIDTELVWDWDKGDFTEASTTTSGSYAY